MSPKYYSEWKACRTALYAVDSACQHLKTVKGYDELRMAQLVQLRDVLWDNLGSLSVKLEKQQQRRRA